MIMQVKRRDREPLVDATQFYVRFVNTFLVHRYNTAHRTKTIINWLVLEKKNPKKYEKTQQQQQ